MSDSLPQRYKNFDDLPDHIKAAIKYCEIEYMESFLNDKISILGYRSVLDMLNEKGREGERWVLEYIERYEAEHQRYQKFDDLPDHIKAGIRRCDVKDKEDFINYKIPLMGYRSVLNMLNREGQEGERDVLWYIKRFQGM
ncbi:MAG: hypothetical protein ACYSWZ_08695 [Planctomycetota bacterium]|jgi:hypothetical protein